jgi:serine/threonine protein kinase
MSTEKPVRSTSNLAEAKPGALPELPRPSDKKPDLQDFTVMRTLGTGSFGRVHLVKEKDGKQFFAMKALTKSEIVKNRQIEHTINEKNILAALDHPFIVRLHATFQDSKHLFLVLEYVQGGELFTFLRKQGVSRFSECVPSVLIILHSHSRITWPASMRLKSAQLLSICIAKISSIEI